MIGGSIEGIKAMPFGLDVRAFGERESHSPENRDATIQHLRERMKGAALMRCARKRKIEYWQPRLIPSRRGNFQAALQLRL